MKKNNTKIYDIIFLVIIILILIIGLVKVLTKSNENNYYENRKSYQLPKITLNTIKNKQYQNNIELALADQLPVAIIMKKVHNFLNVLNINLITDFIYQDNCRNTYMPIQTGLTKFGCDNNLVFNTENLIDNQKLLDNNIENYNKYIENYNNIDFYLYYIEKDTDLNLENNSKNLVYEYIKENINIKEKNINRFEIKNANEFIKYFYKTDHHWNHKGSYKAYKEVVTMMKSGTLLLEPIQEKCFSKSKFKGSKALIIGGGSLIFKEKFCVYDFKIPKHITMINGKICKNDNIINKSNITTKEINYAKFYGNDNGLTYFDFNQPKKDNLLIIGDSYDNALNKLIATHYNKTYNIDLRNYEREMKQPFLFDEFIKTNNINDVLLIGNIDFYRIDTFTLKG
ncbi:MAG: DHHW family protein [Bacilli bacterium]